MPSGWRPRNATRSAARGGRPASCGVINDEVKDVN
jgi:hypothetical protein